MKKLCIFCVCLLLAALALPGAVLAEAENYPPVAENLEIFTYRGVSVGGKLSATDPEGEALTFTCTTEPMKGELSLEPDGSFTYTPLEGKRGKDYFGFRAQDAAGNLSQEATVLIRIEKQTCNVSYSDLRGDGGECAAVFLAERGVYTGEMIGGAHVFGGGRSVSRGEFLSMAMELCGADVLSGAAATGFSDDGDIAPWLKPYVSTALLGGYISGYETEGAAAQFRPEDAITWREASIMMDNLLSVTDVIDASADAAGGDWAWQACANLSACGVLTHEGDLRECLTLSDAAEFLMNAAGLLTRRGAE